MIKILIMVFSVFVMGVVYGMIPQSWGGYWVVGMLFGGIVAIMSMYIHRLIERGSRR